MTEMDVSPTGQYMLGVYDLQSPEKISFVKVILLSSVENTKKNAKYYYLLANKEEATSIQFAFCVSVEEYLGAANEKLRDTVFTVTEEKKDDIVLTLKMLHDWNTKQKNPAESYSAALNSLLKQIALMDDFDDRFTKLKEIALMLIQID
jgi:hypothetical protein